MNPDEMEQNFDKAQQGLRMLSIARAGMDKLTALGENVSMGDLVKSAGKLVAAGLDATAVASLLADAPQENPKLLAEWITQQDIQLHQREAQLKLATRDLQYHMGIAGVQMIAQGMASQGGPLSAAGGAEPEQSPTSSPDLAPTVNPLSVGGPNG